MPKEKQQVRTQTRRAASKEALKQMHMLLDDEKKYEISSDDDDVIEVDVQPPKKKYKLSHRKSSDGNDRDVIVLKTIPEPFMDLEVVIEELSSAQKTRRDHLNKECQEIDAKIEQIMSAPNTEILYNGVFTTALEITEQIQSILTSSTTVTPTTQYTIPAQTSLTQPTVQSQGLVLQQQQPSYQLVMDPRMGVILGAMSTQNATSNTPPLQLYQPKVTVAQPPTEQAKTRRGVVRQQTVAVSQPPPLQMQKTANLTPAKSKLQVKQNLVKTTPVVTKPQVAQKAVVPPKSIVPMKTRTQPPAPFRPTENNVEGGLSMGKPTKSIDLTSEDGRALPDSREVSFNKLQGRTYPSLVVVARPHLRVKDLAADRGKLDVKVKSVLMYPPTKFTEWLIQQGLVRSDQKCSIHTNNALKLGMYSDASKFPYSGGYVWISECCPQRFVSVFSGSLFEGSQHPPMAILKLMYHWCCQTIVQNVTQWVKVDNLYVKGMYTWLRAVCTVALHTRIKQLGGPGVKVQVGVISLGTTSQDGNKREVKVEVLGILETTTRHLRLRAVEPLTDGERNYKKRFTKILEPVFKWVHPSSIIITDLTVDKATLHQMGFFNVNQNTSNDYADSNRTIMEYLRRIVPRMFQNTLSLLSRQIIQQFLDELVWREWYGTTVLQCFDNMIKHLSEQTRYDSGQSLVVRLNKVSANPFKNWAIPQLAVAPVPPTPKPIEPATNTPTPSTTPNPKRYSRQRKQVVTPQPSSPVIQDVVRPVKSTSPDVPEQMVPLENYYYGTIAPAHDSLAKVTINIKCPFCKLTFTSNISLMNHLFKHAHNVSNDVQLCKYCLTIVPSGADLLKHINTSHPDETKFDNGFVCLICESHFRNPFILGKHMSKEHCPSELPYLCGTCGFRCSNHKLAVDHFYQHHDHGTTIQCPFCLKSTTIFSSGRNITQNMNYFIQHLQKHQKKQLAKRCGRCTLWFIQKEFLKDHQTKMHVSQRGKHRLVPCFAPRNGVMVPKSKMDKCPNDQQEINFNTLYFNVGKNLNCKECNKLLSSPKHFSSFQTCTNSQNCQYSTCCATAMQEHNSKCKTLHENIPREKLPFEMFCICGYRDIYGNQMARHLAICERKSAYPSKQAAKSATMTQCMLDVLGLVRKPEEPPTPRPETNSVQPIILKRGRPRKYPGLTKTPSKEGEEDSETKDEDDDVSMNISEVRGGVELKEDDKKEEKKVEENGEEEVDKNKGEEAEVDRTGADKNEEEKREEVEEEKREEVEEEKRKEVEEEKTKEVDESQVKEAVDEEKTEEVEDEKTDEVEEEKTQEVDEPQAKETVDEDEKEQKEEKDPVPEESADSVSNTNGEEAPEVDAPSEEDPPSEKNSPTEDEPPPSEPPAEIEEPKTDNESMEDSQSEAANGTQDSEDTSDVVEKEVVTEDEDVNSIEIPRLNETAEDVATAPKDSSEMMDVDECTKETGDASRDEGGSVEEVCPMDTD